MNIAFNKDKEIQKITSLNTEKLLHRSQFVLGPYFVEKFSSWEKIKINSRIHLTVHPELSTYRVNNNGKSITLLGYILDPNNPEDTDSDIVNKLSHKMFNNGANCFKQTYDFGGRWILIVDDGKEIRLFTDPAGLRQVMFTDKKYTKDFWCASQYGTIAEIMNFEMDKEAVEFINAFKEKNKQYYWPGGSSPYKEIKRLLPNHFLELNEGKCYRYWPDKALERSSLDQAVGICSHYLEGLMLSASNRFNLVLSLSSGWDSRLLLASCKNVKNNISYLTELKDDMTENHPDLTIPSRLLSKWNLNHDIIKLSTEKVDDDFKEIYYKNVPIAHDRWALMASASRNYSNLNKVAVVGMYSDIAKCHYHRKLSRREKKITPEILTRLIYMENDKFVVKLYKEWLAGLGEIYNYNILDLFYGEQRSIWIATNNLEFDLGWQDIFIPYNCRSLIITMLSVDAKFRKPPKYILLKKMIYNLWPEVLCEPINPHKMQFRGKLWRWRNKEMLRSYYPAFMHKAKRLA